MNKAEEAFNAYFLDGERSFWKLRHGIREFKSTKLDSHTFEYADCNSRRAIVDDKPNFIVVHRPGTLDQEMTIGWYEGGIANFDEYFELASSRNPKLGPSKIHINAGNTSTEYYSWEQVVDEFDNSFTKQQTKKAIEGSTYGLFFEES